MSPDRNRNHNVVETEGMRDTKIVSFPAKKPRVINKELGLVGWWGPEGFILDVYCDSNVEITRSKKLPFVPFQKKDRPDGIRRFSFWPKEGETLFIGDRYVISEITYHENMPPSAYVSSTQDIHVKKYEEPLEVRNVLRSMN
ncbi:MAG: hypothetical protein NUV69_05335 [Candidatus Curtissbacteria bacterium]|nr:hypothetical protein [Candidatus Curtissbacteria bacterium]